MKVIIIRGALELSEVLGEKNNYQRSEVLIRNGKYVPAGENNWVGAVFSTVHFELISNRTN